MNKTKIFTLISLVSILIVLTVFVCFEKFNESHKDVVISTYNKPEIKQSNDNEVAAKPIILNEQEKNESEIQSEQEKQKQLELKLAELKQENQHLAELKQETQHLKDEFDLMYNNKFCNKLSEDEYNKFTCLSRNIPYSQYLKDIKESKNCDDYNNDLKRRNDNICDQIINTLNIELHATKNLDNDSDYNFMCGYNECLKSKLYPPEIMRLNNVFPIQFVKIVDDGVFIKFINNTDIEFDVQYIMDNLELRYFKDEKLKKIKYDSGVIAIYNNKPIVLPEFVAIGPKESFIAVYSFNTKRFTCKDLISYLNIDKDNYVLSTFTGVTDCADSNSFQL
jgi:hypothetical protein